MSSSSSFQSVANRRLLPALILLVLGLSIAPAVRANVVTLLPSKDNTLYQDGANSVSNGAGEYVFMGKTDVGNIRRTLLAFDIAAAVPAGATINSVSLTLYSSRAKVNTAYNASLHRVLADWGEGTSNAGGQEGGGTTPTTGDATWFYRFYQTSTWSTPGGDYAATPSATTAVGANGQTYTWTSAGLTADVLAWLAAPATNHGWILIGGEEVASRSAKRFNSRTNTANQPRLTIDYTPAGGSNTGACCLPDNSCSVIDSLTCAAGGGIYQGDNTPCSPDPCPITVTLLAQKDNTLYQSATGSLSNGAGEHLFAGNDNSSLRRRAVLAFDLAGIPPQAIITAATLQLHTTQTGTTGGVALHRALASWGEGTSDATGGESNGASSTTNDATWLHRFYSTSLWSAPGGDYAASASASIVVSADAFYSWSGSGVVSDVQAWIQNPSGNAGWVLVGNEAASATVRRFASRTYAANVSYRPLLRISYTLPPPDPIGACCLDDGSCSQLSETQCNLQGGTYQGDLTPCMPHMCPLVLTPFVDPLPIPPLATPSSGTIGGVATYDIPIVEFEQKLHRDLPPTTLWGYDGRYPGPTILASRGNPVTVNWINDLRDSTGALRTEHYLPVDQCMHGPDMAGTGARVVVHLHGGHVSPANDGYPDSTMNPGQSQTYFYPNNQESSLIWYHDHALGITRLNVMMGLAGGYLIRDPEENALNLPSGAYEVPLVIQDRSFHPDGRLDYPATWQDHFFGDVALVNGMVWPYFNVNRATYRFRLLEGSNSRAYTLTLSNGLPFTVIGGDGGLLEKPVVRSSVTFTPGERLDVLVDFSSVAPGTEIKLLNSAPSPFPVGDAMEPEIPEIMKFIVGSQTGPVYPVPSTLRSIERLEEADADEHRDLVLAKMQGSCAGSMWMINGLGWHDVTERPRLGDTEIWRFVNRSGVVHPMHMHLVMFQVLDRQPFTVVGDSLVFGAAVPPDSTERGWKDTVPVYPNEAVRVIARFEDFTGLFAYHCHILEHEDHEMMRQFEVVDTAVSAVPNVPELPVVQQLALSPGYPNPTTGHTRVAFQMPAEGRARLELFDISGRRVATLFDGVAPSGPNEIAWDSVDEDGVRLAAGLYLYRLSVPGHQTLTRKLVIVK